MAHQSDPAFCTLHALRIKGFAKAEALADITGADVPTTDSHLAALKEAEHASFMENRGLWKLTPGGREHHAASLAADVAGADLAAMKPSYETFLELNEEMKALCGEWQLRDGAPNDHTDAAHDAAVLAKLIDLDVRTRPVVAESAVVLERLAPYVPRLEASCQRFVAGETNMFTGVMCGSYHDVWMELHEDLILTQGIDRAAEGSF